MFYILPIVDTDDCDTATVDTTGVTIPDMTYVLGAATQTQTVPTLSLTADICTKSLKYILTPTSTLLTIAGQDLLV